jgi:trk system potassium uptake protein TrkH
MVVACWLGVVLVGTLPFLLSGLMGPVDAFFYSMTGFTTTGAATVAPEGLSPALLLWRSLSQWIGGIGIIVLFVAIAPQAGFGATATGKTMLAILMLLGRLELFTVLVLLSRAFWRA